MLYRWRAFGLKAAWHRARCWMQTQSKLILNEEMGGEMAHIPKVRRPGADNFSTGVLRPVFLESVMKIGQTAENLVSKQVGPAANGPKHAGNASAAKAQAPQTAGWR